jgi:glutathione S-transferase
MTHSASKQPRIVFHYHPWSRAAGVRWLLEELELTYEVNFVDFNAPDGLPEAYRAIHPHKKVPAIEIEGQILTERAAITIYLADRFSLGRLAPSLEDPCRAGYLKALVYNDSVVDPCVALHFKKIEHKPSDYSFGAYEDTIRHLKEHFRAHPFAAGPRFTAADTQLASTLGYTIHQLGAVPKEPEFLAYLERVADRPAHLRAQELDAELMQSVMARRAG